MSGSGGTDAGAGNDGDPGSGLPPQAPAYDLRTGEPLAAPRDSDQEKPASDFTASDLGIWAPSSDAPDSGGSTKGAPPQYGTGGYQPTDPPYAPQAWQPTPPPSASPTSPPGRPGTLGGTSPQGQYNQPTYQQTPYQQPTYPQSGFPPSGQGFPGPGSAPTAQHPVPPTPPRRGPMLLAAAVGVLVILVAVLVGVLVFGGSSKTPVASTSAGTSSGTASTQPSGGQPSSGSKSGSSNGSTSGSSNADRQAFLSTVDGILTQSASGRQQVSSVVTGVVNGCSVTPENASATIRQVIVNRQAVLGQANALSPVDAATEAVKTDLVQALTASIEANHGYQQWLDQLYATYFNADPVGCPDGRAPTDSNYDAATAASGRATAAKQAFVAAYNPLASAAGLRTWSDSEF